VRINYRRISLRHKLSKKCYKIVKFVSITHSERNIWNGPIVATAISREKLKPYIPSTFCDTQKLCILLTLYCNSVSEKIKSTRLVRDLRFSQRYWWEFGSSGMWRRDTVSVDQWIPTFRRVLKAKQSKKKNKLFSLEDEGKMILQNVRKYSHYKWQGRIKSTLNLLNFRMMQ
jgi:hypothetical protein